MKTHGVLTEQTKVILYVLFIFYLRRRVMENF
jgi:hypothetical protein